MSKKYKNIKKGAFLAGAGLIGLFGIGTGTGTVHAVPNGIQLAEPALNEGWSFISESNAGFRLYVKKYPDGLLFASFEPDGVPCGHCMINTSDAGVIVCDVGVDMHVIDPAVGHLFDNGFFNLFESKNDPVTNCRRYNFNGAKVTVFSDLSYIVEE